MTHPPLVSRALEHGQRTALITDEGTFTYSDLLDASARVAGALLGEAASLSEARVAFLTPPGFDYAATQWGIWRAGGLAVPLATMHPEPELQYVIEDADAEIIIAHESMAGRIKPIAERLGRRFMLTDELLGGEPAAKLPTLKPDGRAMMLYTSGSTGRPKGVVTTHSNIEYQIRSLVEAWEWSPDDRILHNLPLHHIHGVINAMGCCFWVGATCELLPKFDPEVVWNRLSDGDFTLYMAVPTIYTRLIATWEAQGEATRKRWSEGCANLRLMVSGSAALPVSILERWQEITGHRLLERYGMTEIGMGLSNPYRGERRAGHVGMPLPYVEARLIDDDGSDVTNQPGKSGQVQIKGPTVFSEYWRRPEATAESFTEDGWFLTGDVGVIEEGYYRLLGRSSVDIIKTGGEKVSAIEIEETLRQHPCIKDCAVVGIIDPEWGERVCVAIVCWVDAPEKIDVDSLRSWGKERLAVYKVPKDVLVVDDLPRNAMGKVTKPAVKTLFSKE